eukprot:TRINITY_DN7338_c0_g1_i4.p1 TRINITY_DN7338_c0_g1~~TRINITY_DN7338_c0_g1_i4.p1  ORF type:complete len:133 (+),score=19.09 TRINITY_DN7338_c0_g1_i4:146-544(+)
MLNILEAFTIEMMQKQMKESQHIHYIITGINALINGAFFIIYIAVVRSKIFRGNAEVLSLLEIGLLTEGVVALAIVGLSFYRIAVPDEVGYIPISQPAHEPRMSEWELAYELPIIIKKEKQPCFIPYLTSSN